MSTSPEFALAYSRSCMESILKNPRQCEFFLEFLKNEYAEENLEFWLACEQYKSASPDSQPNIAKEIFEKYIKVGSVSQINVDDVFRGNLQNQILAGRYDLQLFTPIQNQVFELIFDDNFRRYFSHLSNFSPPKNNNSTSSPSSPLKFYISHLDTSPVQTPPQTSTLHPSPKKHPLFSKIISNVFH
eukprot:Sdes_comp17352_c0_seq1m6561